MASPRGQKEEERAARFGALIRKLRRDGRENQSQLAERIPMSSANLSRLELGKQGPPSDEVIERIAAALNANPKELLRAAGRDSGGPSVEKQILDRLDALGREMEILGRDLSEVKTAVLKSPPRS